MLEVQYPMEVTSRAWDIEVYVQSSVKAPEEMPTLSLSLTPFLPRGDRIRRGSDICPEFHSMTENGKSKSERGLLGSKQ